VCTLDAFAGGSNIRGSKMRLLQGIVRIIARNVGNL